MNSLIINYNEKDSDGSSFPPLVKNSVGIINLTVPPFKYSDSIDVSIHNFLLGQIANQEFDKVFIPISITQNYLNFTGIYLGLHLRYTYSLSSKCQVPIVFYADKEETKEFINSLSIWGQFLFTKGVYLIEEKLDILIEYSQKKLVGVTQDYISNDLTRRTIVSPPSFYDNRHSIANEWALLLLDSVSGHNILTHKPELQEIRSSLYVKWLMAKNKVNLPINDNQKQQFIIPITRRKRILLIEDEWNKGWKELYQAFFGDKCEFDYLEIQKKDKESDILEKLEAKLEKEWDLFLLDVRLTDDDHNEDREYFEYTGIEILEKIITRNSGNQVILTSASNKYWIYSYGKEIGASGVIVKPDINSNLTFDDLGYLFNTPIQECFNKEKLKEVHTTSTELIKKLEQVDCSNDNLEELVSGLIILLKNGLYVFRNINSKNNEELGIIFITYFKMFEYLGQFLIIYNDTDEEYQIDLWDLPLEEFWVSRGRVHHNEIATFEYKKKTPSIVNKMAGIFKQVLRYSDSKVINFNKFKEMRRKWIHPNFDKGEAKTKFDKASCVKIFRLSTKVVSDFIDKYEEDS